MNLKEKGVQIKSLITRNDESVLCQRRPTGDGWTETSHGANFLGGRSQLFDVIILFGIESGKMDPSSAHS